jgi:hypothetical protein
LNRRRVTVASQRSSRSVISSLQSTTALMAAYFFASPIDIDVKLEGEELRKQVELKGDKDKTSSCPVYYDGDSVTGQVRISFNFCRKWGDLICRR